MTQGELRIYLPEPQDDVEFCHLVDSADFENIRLLINGAQRKKVWAPITIQLIQEDEGVVLSRSDSPWLSGSALTFRPEAVSTLEPMLSQNGELLPLNCDDVNLHVYNPTLVLDALDEEASSIVRFSDGRVMHVDSYEFQKSVIQDIPIFKIPQFRVSPAFVNQEFVQLWESNKLCGLDFKLIWAST